MQHVVHVALSIAWLTATWGGASGRELQLAPSPMGAKWRGNRGSKGPTTANTTDSNQRKQPSAVRPARSAAFYVISSRGSVTKWSFLSLSPFPFVFVDVMFFFSLISYSSDQNHTLHTHSPYYAAAAVGWRLIFILFYFISFHFISSFSPNSLLERIFLGILFLPLPLFYVEFICTVHPNGIA